MGTYQHTGNQQTHKIGKAAPPDERWNRSTDAHQQCKHPKGVMHHMLKRGLHRHRNKAECP